MPFDLTPAMQTEFLPAAAERLAIRQPQTAILPTNPTARRFELMGLPLDNIHRDDIVIEIVSAAQDDRKLMVVNANAHMVVQAQKLPWMKALFAQADIAFCDGAGVQLACKFLRKSNLHRTTPPAWIGEALRRLGAGASIFWLGGTPEAVTAAAAAYEAEFGVRTAGTQHGYFDMSADSAENADLVARINAARPTIILVNMGMPRQERWVFDNWDRLESGIVITAGALVDHAAGLVHRPPQWIADIGFEWLVRLVREPRRLWRRYVLGLPVFGLYVLRYRAAGREG